MSNYSGRSLVRAGDVREEKRTAIQQGGWPFDAWGAVVPLFLFDVVLIVVFAAF